MEENPQETGHSSSEKTEDPSELSEKFQEDINRQQASPPHRLRIIKGQIILGIGLGVAIGILVTIWFSKSKIEKWTSPRKAEDMYIHQPLLPFFAPISTDEEDHFIRVRLELGLKDKDLGKEVMEKLPRLRSLIYDILISQKIESLRKAGERRKLKSKILWLLNRELKDGQVKKIFFTDFMVY